MGDCVLIMTLLFERFSALLAYRMVIRVFIGSDEKPYRNSGEVEIIAQSINQIAPIAFRQFSRPRAFEHKGWRAGFGPVSYTHLTLPTICSV